MVTGGINLEDLFFQAYGYKSAAFQFDKKELESDYASLGSKWYAKDKFGREYFLPVTLESSDGKKYQLPFPIVSVRGKKIVIDTPMVERNGSVHEYIAMDDYDLTIRGFLIGNNGKFPEDDIKALFDCWRKNESFRMRCALTDPILEGDQKVFIRFIDLPEAQGKNTKTYTIELSSDQDFELEEV